MNWPSRRLSDLCEINIGRTPARDRSEYWGVGYPWLSISDMSAAPLVDQTKEQITPAAVRDCHMRIAPKGCVLLSFKLSIGKVGVAARSLYTNEAIAALPILDANILDRDFLVWSLRSLDLTAGLDRAAKGLTLNKAKLAELKICLPPITEQRRIAEILNHADDLRRRRRLTLERLDRLYQAIFLDMFGDPVKNPKQWPRRLMGDIGRVVTGNTPSRAISDYYGNAIEWVKSDNINTPYYYLTEASEGLSSSGRRVGRVAPPNSILVTCIAGSPDCIGNSAMTDREVAFNQQINALVPFEGNPHFLYGQFIVGKNLVQQASTEGMKGLVSKSRFEAISFMFPPVPLQDEFAQRALAVEEIRTSAYRSQKKIDALFASLQHRAFNGELTAKAAERELAEAV